MKLNIISKSLLTAIPALLLVACGSAPDADEKSKAGTTNSSQQSEGALAQTEGGSATTNSVQVATVENAQSPEEVQQMKYDALRQEQTLYFGYDKAQVNAKYLELLQAHADFLIKNPTQKVMIEGHCDERGTPEYNIALGERRAKAVAQYLQSLGVMASQITTVSYGEEKPLDLSRTKAGFAKNRRTELVY